MKSRWRSRSVFRSSTSPSFGTPKYKKGDAIGEFMVIMYQGHSDVNKRNNRIMSKPQHWYRCMCSCGNFESRSQQELRDPRRNQCCETCRTKANLNLRKLNEDQPD